MAYSDFTLAELKQRFQLAIDESNNLFADVPETDLPPTLARYLPLAVNLNTEKARSELIIVPVLAEFRYGPLCTEQRHTTSEAARTATITRADPISNLSPQPRRALERRLHRA